MLYDLERFLIPILTLYNHGFLVLKHDNLEIIKELFLAYSFIKYLVFCNDYKSLI